MPSRDAEGFLGTWEREPQTERSPRDPEEVRRLLVENAVELIRLFHFAGTSVYGNPAVERLLGATPARFGELSHPDDHDSALKWFDRVLAGDRACLHWRVRGSGGEWRWLETQGTVVAYRGEPHLLTVCRDITDRKQTEMRLQRAEEQARKVLDTIPEQIASGPPEGTLDYCNRQWLAYAGLTLEELQGGGWQRLLHPDDKDRVLSAWQESVATGKPYEQEERHRRFDGVYRWFLARGVPLRDAEGRIERWYGTMTDIEDRKQAEEALRESANRLRDLSRRLFEIQEEERRHLARELHDEFGQLLATVTLHLHAAKGAPAENARSRLDESLALLQRAGEQVRSLALELRPTMLETAGLDAALRWLADQHQRQTGIATEVLGHVNSLSSELAIACFRVVQEALTNVVRHARAQHVWIKLKLSNSLDLVVRDDGAGFDVEETLKNATARGSLGLLGMKERVELFGGSLEVASRPERGTRIHADFPLPASSRAEPRPPRRT